MCSRSRSRKGEAEVAEGVTGCQDWRAEVDAFGT